MKKIDRQINEKFKKIAAGIIAGCCLVYTVLFGFLVRWQNCWFSFFMFVGVAIMCWLSHFLSES